MKAYNWGIMGTGRIAHKFAKALMLLDNAHLYAAGSRDAGRDSAGISEAMRRCLLIPGLMWFIFPHRIPCTWSIRLWLCTTASMLYVKNQCQ